MLFIQGGYLGTVATTRVWLQLLSNRRLHYTAAIIPALSWSPHQVVTTSHLSEVWTANEHIFNTRNQLPCKAVYLFHLLDKYQNTVNILNFENYLSDSHRMFMRTNDTLITPKQLFAFGHHEVTTQMFIPRVHTYSFVRCTNSYRTPSSTIEGWRERQEGSSLTSQPQKMTPNICRNSFMLGYLIQRVSILPSTCKGF